MNNVAVIIGFLFFFGCPSLLAQGTIRFAAVGDYGGWDIGNDRTRDVANLIKGWNPEFIITLGDNNYPKGEARTIDFNIGQQYHQFIFPYRGSYGAGATENRFFPALGNHDLFEATCQGDVCQAAYFDYFQLPGNERYYDFIKGPVHFFVINSDAKEPHGITADSRQAAWLRGRLAASTSCWQFVYMHHAPYTSSPRGNAVALQWPYTAWGADIVMTGHEHHYERLFREGIPYIVNGAGGREPYPFASTPTTGSQIRYNGDNGAMRIEASCSAITFRFINRQGTVIDTYTLQNTSAATATFSAVTAVQQVGDVALSWTTTNERNLNRFIVERSFNGGSFEAVAEMAATGGQNQTRSYSYLDANRPSGSYVYRIRWNGLGGQTGISQTAAVQVTRSSVAFGALDATDQAGSIVLTWTTTSEVAVNRFAVERSFEGGAFEEIASLSPAGSPTQDRMYSYTLQNAPSGTYQFRVRWYGVSGQQGVSSMVSITEARPVVAFEGLSLEQDFDSLRVHWHTSQEANLQRFSVEQIIPDGSLVTVGVVLARNTASEYDFTLADPQLGRQEYHLKWTAQNGEVGYSNAVAVTVEADIEWASFSAEQMGEDELLKWVTEGEFNIAEFRVQRRSNSDDFVSLDTVEAVGLSRTPSSYRHVVQQTPVGTYGFRVQWVGSDSTTGFSPEITSTIKSEMILNTQDVELEGSDILYNWTTISEVYLIGFAVELEGEDGQFTELVYIPAQGSVGDETIYQYRIEGLPSGDYRFRLRWEGEDGTVDYTDPLEITLPSGVSTETDVPLSYNLEAAYPDPVSTLARIRYTLPRPGQVRLVVYDALGRPVRTLVDAETAAGTHAVTFDTGSLPAGIYFYHMMVENRALFTRKVVVVKAP